MTDTREILSYVVIIIIGIILAQHLNVVVSGSMEPVFYRGDVVVIQKANFLGIHEINTTDLNVGDIVIYDATWFPEPVIHRIIFKGTTPDGKLYYKTKGDNNPAADPVAVYPQQIQAKVISFGKTPGETPFIIPKIGYITLWIRGL
jgi:signal peptidase I